MTARPAGRSGRRTGAGDRIAAMVDEKLAQGLEFEALQLYKARAARKAAMGDSDGAAAIAEAGATELMTRGYPDAATELAVQVVEVWAGNHVPPNDERRERVLRLNELYEVVKQRQGAASGGSNGKEEGAGGTARNAADAAAATPTPTTSAADASASNDDASSTKPAAGAAQGGDNGEPAKLFAAAAGTNAAAQSSGSDAAATTPPRVPVAQLQIRFLKAAFKWGHAEGERVYGDPVLAALLGRALLAGGELDSAIRYLAVGEEPVEMIDGIWAGLPGRGQRSAREGHAARVARGILHLLTLGNMRDANKALDRARERLGKDSEPQLIQFCGMLLLTCERAAPDVFLKLQEMFAGNLSVDPRLGGYLHGVGQRYFDIQPPKTMMDSLMSMFTG